VNQRVLHLNDSYIVGLSFIGVVLGVGGWVWFVLLLWVFVWFVVGIGCLGGRLGIWGVVGGIFLVLIV
jgi:hypothetical protein